MKKIELIHTIKCHNLLGEGVQWNTADKSFWWTDILSKKLFRYQLAAQALDCWDLPERLGCFAFTDKRQEILCAFESGIAWYHIENQTCEWIAKPESYWPGNRMNDGRCDRQGRFWVGSITEDKHYPEQSASLYCLDSKRHLSQHLSGLHISNALCWSVDSSKLYHADSPSHKIHIYDFDKESGRLSNKKLFVEVEKEIDPDGATIDADDYLWNAQWGGWRVVRYNPNGTEDFRLNMPVANATCIAFGGEDFSLLAVTSASIGLSADDLLKQPDAGNLFIFKTDFAGVAESKFLME